MNDLSLLAIAFIIYACRGADRVIHTCYFYYGSFSLLFKLINITRFILELMTELTQSKRK
jgi:hypothetical protein